MALSSWLPLQRCISALAALPATDRSSKKTLHAHGMPQQSSGHQEEPGRGRNSSPLPAVPSRASLVPAAAQEPRDAEQPQPGQGAQLWCHKLTHTETQTDRYSHTHRQTQTHQAQPCPGVTHTLTQRQTHQPQPAQGAQPWCHTHTHRHTPGTAMSWCHTPPSVTHTRHSSGVTHTHSHTLVSHPPVSHTPGSPGLPRPCRAALAAGTAPCALAQPGQALQAGLGLGLSLGCSLFPELLQGLAWLGVGPASSPCPPEIHHFSKQDLRAPHFPLNLCMEYQTFTPSMHSLCCPGYRKAKNMLWIFKCLIRYITTSTNTAILMICIYKFKTSVLPKAAVSFSAI